MAVKIIPLTMSDTELIEQAATLLVNGFAENWPNAWPTLDDGRQELQECIDPENIVLGALTEDNRLLGWIGGQPEYYGTTWELHPLVVDPAAQGQGVGRLLVEALEREAASRGGLTIMLGSDDENEMTSLAGVDLYPDVWTHIAQIKNFKNHPYSFYEKMGYAIVGVIPDANGPGRPDILMAKRIKKS
ncbi:MAG: GNAT family N-acetyltransferase [Ardenticatenaceae bacterium]|nr:GNAT family N-acetyltransferase [Ardenticatenaceae bacterium]